MPREDSRRSVRLAEVPQSYGPVRSSGAEAVAVGSKGDGVDRALMPGED